MHGLMLSFSVVIFLLLEETTLRVREEEEKRKEVSTKFQSTLTEVSALLRQNNEKNAKLREENAEMAGKLQTLCDQYAVREEHLGKLGKQYVTNPFLLLTRVY